MAGGLTREGPGLRELGEQRKEVGEKVGVQRCEETLEVKVTEVSKKGSRWEGLN